MRPALLILFSLLVCCSIVTINGIKQGKETWGYVNVRQGAHMFFWLYYTTAPVDYKSRPLVLWLQGGPGASSTGIGNFMEIGPQDVQLNNRTVAWTQEVNVLFVDNPVGTGFSYVEDPHMLPRNNTAVALDLVAFMQGFFNKVPEFQDVPLYIFSESYGGKMAARFALSLTKAVQQKKVTCQLAGVAMGDSWISPVDAVLSWGPFLYSTSLVDSVGLEQVNAKAQAVEGATKAGKWADATKLWAETEDLVENVTNNVNFYNILNHNHDESNHVTGHQRQYHFTQPHLEGLYQRHVGAISDDLDKLMNGHIRDKLKVIPANVTWGGQSRQVFEALAEDFMTSAVQNVESLLNTTAIKVVVYNGQLDLIVDTLGVLKWVEGLHWAGTGQWTKAQRKALTTDQGKTVLFSKAFKNFHFYWILEAGHMVPADASVVAMTMLKEIVGIKTR